MARTWDLACPDWEDRIRSGRTLVPDLPLFHDEADLAIEFFNSLRLPDVPNIPLLRDAAGEWFRDIVKALFGSRDPKTNLRYIREVFALVGKGNSKAIALDTLIATPSGFTTMRDVQIGDEVIDADGRPTKVIEKSPVFIGSRCFEIEFSTGEKVVCDAEHLWVTDAHTDRKRYCRQARGSYPTVKRTDDIATSLKVSSGQYQLHNHRTVLAGPLDLPIADLPIPPYALGAWLGDGTTESATLTAGLLEADHMVEQLVANGQPAYVRSRYPEKGSVTITLGIPNTRTTKLPYRFRAEAVRLGLLGRKHIPTAYLRASFGQRLALLRGLMDTDGCISKTGQATFTTTKPQLRDDIRELINSLGFKSSVSEHRTKLYGKDCGPMWLVQFWPFDDLAVFTIPRKLDRQKARKPKTAALSKSRQIVACRPVQSVPVQCIAVASETKQYLVTRSLIPTHNTSYGAGMMVTALLMNTRPHAEFLLVGPTQAISELAFNQAAGMIDADPELKKRFHVRYHRSDIKDRLNESWLRIKTFSLDILTGPKPVGVLLDELHLLGKSSQTGKVLTQIRGGLEKNTEGFLIIITTQSDDIPAGAFKDELQMARSIRDGRFNGRMLPILYEFPPDIAKDQSKWADPANWPMVTPNLGRSLRLDSLIKDWESEQTKGEHAIRIWASQHLNIEIGIGLHSDRWGGADFWTNKVDDKLTLESLIERSEVVVVGIDGGGLDDLLGIAVLGREKVTRKWLLWSKAWAHKCVLERRKSIAAKLYDFEREGTLVFVEDDSNDDVMEVAAIVQQVEDAGVLAGKHGIGVDPVGITEIVDELERCGFDADPDTGRITGISQGWTLSNTIKTAERKLAFGDLIHSGTGLMAWAVGNAKVEPRGNAISITKQAAGTAKIDPLMALFNAVALMARNPDGARSIYEEEEFLI